MSRPRLSPLLVVAVSCGMGVTACGRAGVGSGVASHASLEARLREARTATAGSATSPAAYVKGDDDTDSDDYTDHYRGDDYTVRDYGQEAGAARQRAITVLVKRYFKAAAKGDVAVACSLLSSRLAERRDLSTAVPADYASPRTAALHGEACVQFMSDLFRLSEQQLAAADIATLVVTSVRVKGSVGLALLGFSVAKERQIPVRREHGAWKIDALLDLPIP
jgi:hypothetical protein